MARKLLVLIAVCVLAGNAFAQKPATATKTKTAAQPAAVDQALITKEKELWEAWKNHNAAPFKESLAENAVLVDESGIRDKARFLEELPKQGCQANKVSLEDFKVTMLDSDSPALTYKVTVDGACKGKPVPVAQASSVYTKRGGKWLIALHQESALP